MPQIGWFEILIVVIIAILIIGPKEFPVVLRKIGSWISSFKSYFSDVQKDVTEMGNAVEEEISFENETSKSIDKNKKND